VGRGLFGGKDSLARGQAAKYPHVAEFRGQPDSALIKIEVGDYIVAGLDKAQRAHLGG
jgi:hypothetical protein